MAGKRFDALLSTGAQTYESLFHLGAIAEQREDTDRALRNYARVTGGDFALPAQVRVARIKADKSGTEAGLLHHTDQGCTYASEDDQRILDVSGITFSMSRRGNCDDNAVMKAFISSLK